MGSNPAGDTISTGIAAVSIIPSDHAMIELKPGDLDDPRVIALVEAHARRARAETGQGSAHALDPDAFAAPDIELWTAWDGDRLVGIAALKQLSVSLGELKSMHTVEAFRGRGIGGRLLEHLIERARRQGLSRLSLETGSWPYFDPARAFYARHGFTPCPPFGPYRPDPNSVFLTRTI